MCQESPANKITNNNAIAQKRIRHQNIKTEATHQQPKNRNNICWKKKDLGQKHMHIEYDKGKECVVVGGLSLSHKNLQLFCFQLQTLGLKIFIVMIKMEENKRNQWSKGYNNDNAVRCHPHALKNTNSILTTIKLGIVVVE